MRVALNENAAIEKIDSCLTLEAFICKIVPNNAEMRHLMEKLSLWIVNIRLSGTEGVRRFPTGATLLV